MKPETKTWMAAAKKNLDDAISALKVLPLKEIRAIHEEAGCPATKSPNATFLARQALTALVAALPDEDAATEAPKGKRVRITKPEKQPRVKPPAKTVAELQAEYLDVVGRPTDSDNEGYLKWKIREAKKGNIKIGAIERGAKGDPKDEMVLPLRMDRPDVEQLDAHWKHMGFKSRMEFLRDAIAHATAIGLKPGFVAAATTSEEG